MKQFVIRKALLNDAEYISLLGRVTFTETFGHYFSHQQDLLDYYDNTFSVAKIRASLQNENNVFWIALWDELPVGYAKLKRFSKSDFIDSANVSQLQKIYVLKDFHAKKIGYQLQEAVFAEIIRLDNRTVWLSVLKNNINAITFYKKSGFLETGQHHFSIGRENFDFLVLKKEF